VSEPQRTHVYDNGLVLLAEPMPWLESAAWAIFLPAGCCCDPPSRLGLSSLTTEMVQRGCGPRDSRQFLEALERLGVEHNSSVTAAHSSFSGATVAENLCDALALYADLVRRPHLPAEQLEDARQVCLQEVRAAEDDVAHKVMQELRRRHYPDPWGRPSQGELAPLERVVLKDVQTHVATTYVPRGTILAVAGNFPWERLRDTVGQLFGDWPAAAPPEVQETSALNGYQHLTFDSSQTQIGVAFASVPYRHPDYFQARGAVGVLSDGMSSRLFTEVREKRGLCYSVYASCHSLRDRGSVQCYAGTSTQRAQETLNVLVDQLHQLAQGIQQAELDRLNARIKSNLIMQQESSGSRCLALAVDWYHLGRVRTLQELGQIIDQLSCESINAYLARNPTPTFTIVTLGAEQLEVPRAVS